MATFKQPKDDEIPAETPLYYASKLLNAALAELQDGSPADATTLKRLQLAQAILSQLDPYLDSHSTYPAYLQPLLRATATHDWAGAYERGDISVRLAPNFSAGPYEGAWIGQFARAVRAKKVLEVGMFTGTTTLCIAHSVCQGAHKADAHVTTLEIFDYLKTFVTPHFEKAGFGQDAISVLTGPAAASLAKLGPSPAGSSNGGADVPAAARGPYDLIFIDADKAGYAEYYRLIMDGGLLAKGGTLLVDNTLYKGAPFTPGLAEFDHQIEADSASKIAEFNDMLVKDERVDVTLLPVRDGVTMVNWRVGA